MNNKFLNKNVLVAGGTGMVGQQLTNLLIENGAQVSIASLDKNKSLDKNIKEFHYVDLSVLQNCYEVSKNKNIVISLLGSTGSPAINFSKPATFMNANLLTAMNMLEGARKAGVEEFLYTSTYGVYSPKSDMSENSMWQDMPSENDKFAGWAKRMGELQVEAYKKQYDWNKIYIARPANIYGPFCNFNETNSMVVASIIKKIFNKKNKVIELWGDGSNIRDFIYSEDVARMMVEIINKEILEPINIGSGIGTTIAELVQTIRDSDFLINKPKIIFDKSKPSGDKKRVLDTSLAKKNNILPKTSLKTGIEKTIEWYLNNLDEIDYKYNAFITDH